MKFNPFYAKLLLIAGAIAVIIIGNIVGSASQKSIVAYEVRVKQTQDVSLPVLTASYIIQYLIVYVAVTIAFRMLNIDTSALLTIVTATGLTVGLALQSPLGNIASGFFLTIQQNFQVGDTLYVTINGGTYVGKVTRFDLLQTTLYDSRTKQTIVIPNRVLHDNIFSKN